MNLPEKPRPTAKDHARTAGNAVIAAVPFVGGSAGVLINAVVRPGYERRLDSWLEQLGVVVADLQGRVVDFDPASLSENELFVSAVIDASRIALGTGLEDKIAMLKAALINIAIGETNDEFLALRYLHFIEELAPEHFRLLAYGSQPRLWHSNDATDPATPRALIDLSEANIDREIVDVLLADLAARGLIETASLSVVADGESALDPFTTKIGAELVRFVQVFE